MLSNSCRYAIRALVYLANQPEVSENTGIRKISQDLNLPTPFLAKILQQLAKQKILISVKGPNGGFSLKMDPGKVTVLDIIKIIDGSDVLTNCVMHNDSCGGVEEEKRFCPIHEGYNKARTELVNLFGNSTIADLVSKARNGEQITI
jgi:Rrf2 family protein